MKYLKRQEGMVIPLVVGLVALVIVVVGVALWQSQQAKTKANTAIISPTPSAVAQTSSTPAPTATPAPANEIKVTELGFKMTLPTGLSDLKYVSQTNLSGTDTSGQAYQYSKASFSTSSLEQKDSSALCTAAHAPLGGITRYGSVPKGLDSGITIRKVGNFYLAFYGTQSACSDNNGIPNFTLTQSALLKQAFDTASAL